MRNLWTTLAAAGLHDRGITSHDRHILFLNTIVLLILLLITQNLLLVAYYDVATLPVTGVLVAHFLCIGLTLLWNYKRWYSWARIWFCLSANVFLTIYSVAMGRESYWELFLGVCVFIQFFIFPATERRWMVFFVLLSSICFMSVHFLVPPQGVLVDLPTGVVRTVTMWNLLGFLFCAIGMGAVSHVTVNRAERRLLAEHERSERLLHNILPASIAQRLKDGEETIADSYESATVMFFDLVSFTPLSAASSPADVVALLSEIFGRLDQLVERHHAEKMETIGDGYMAVAGLTGSAHDHAHVVAALALDIKEYFAAGVSLHGRRVDFRIGMNTGPLSAGVIGRTKIAYKIWGDTVNTASRMESHSIPGQIQMTEATYRLIRHSFVCEHRGPIDIKGKGLLDTYLLKGLVTQEDHNSV